VLLHEFGHALACRQVGGRADCIVLWPLGGIALVDPPPRAGAVLWSIAAGPLVNLGLVPVTAAMLGLAWRAGWEETAPDFFRFLEMLLLMNAVLLIFNLLPIYPLDGGQILQALLWFLIGRGPSLLVASVLGLAGSGLLVLLALAMADWWLLILAGFLALRAVAGFQQAQGLLRLLHAPRHQDLACPTCQAPPLKGDFWDCGNCDRPFDPFACRGLCPRCHSQFDRLRCPECRRDHAIDDWFPAVEPVPPVSQ
jgi:Zn-dependent protease